MPSPMHMSTGDGPEDDHLVAHRGRKSRRTTLEDIETVADNNHSILAS